MKLNSILNSEFLILNADDYLKNSHFSAFSKDSVLFFQSYGNLGMDNYMNDNGTYRFRRFGNFTYNTNTDLLKFIGNNGFFQNNYINTLNGGVLRKFETIEASVANNSFLELLIKTNLAKIDNYADHPEWLVYIHQIRITCNENEAGNPTPEGIHRDGHNYVAQILIAKNGVSGAVSRIYDSNKELLFTKELESPLDTILANDARSYHDVTKLFLQNNATSGYRDMLLIDYNLPE